MITAHFIGDTISSNESKAFEFFEKSRFGEKKQSKIIYSLVEALFLVQKNKMKVTDTRGKSIDEHALLKKAVRLDKRITIKLPAYAKLRDAGMIPKTALKFGAEFRIYSKGIKPGQDHAKWVCFPIKESEMHSWHDFAAKNRVAHAAKKKLLLAIVDDEHDVTFYEVGWVKL